MRRWPSCASMSSGLRCLSSNDRSRSWPGLMSVMVSVPAFQAGSGSPLTPLEGNDAQAAYRLIVHRHAPGDLGRFLASDRLLPSLMDIGDQHDIGNYAFRMALQDQSIRQPADQVILHPEIGLLNQIVGQLTKVSTLLN